MNKRLGKCTILLANPVSVSTYYCAGGKREKEGPLGGLIDYTTDDDTFGEDTWEKAESSLQKRIFEGLISKSGKQPSDVEYLLAGDLLNQCIGSHYGLRDFGVPFFGLFGACSTMAEGLALGSILIDGGFAGRVAALTSSHFCSAERQFRLPLEYGGQRPPTSQWTVTGGAAVLLESCGAGPYVTHITVGRIVDMGIKDVNNMGAAMAPAAADTLISFFRDTGTYPTDYDIIVTGDLGFVGWELAKTLLGKEGWLMGDNYNDCGLMIYDRDKQSVDAGGSGCGCSAVVLASRLLPGLQSGLYRNVLFVGTGALMSPTSVQQGESIPAIAHLVRLSTVKEG